MILVIFGLDWVSEIPLIGPMLNFATTQSYLAGKGMGGMYQLAMLGGNLITEILSAFGLGFIPVDLVVFGGIFLVDHLAPPGIAKTLEKAGEVAGKLEGQGVGTSAEKGAAAAGGATAKGAGAAVGQEATAAGEGGAEEKAGRERKTREKGGGGGEGGGGEGGDTEEGMSEEETAKQAREEEIEKQMRLGAEVPPEEEAQEAIFNPEGIQFREAEIKTPGENPPIENDKDKKKRRLV